jgi:FkbM family methyltransferase
VSTSTASALQAASDRPTYVRLNEVNPLVRRLAHKIETRVSGLLVQPWREHRRLEEHYLSRLLKHLNIDCVFDVGANVGLYGLMLREYCGYGGLIISFEPTPAVAARLKQTSASDDKWVVRESALGLAKGKATFRTMESSEGNSFLALRREEAKDIKINEITVDVECLGEVFPELQKQYKFSRPFLKMDTQGFDLQVFEGGGDAIQSFLGLQSELSVDAFYAGVLDWKESLAHYEKAGFVLSALVLNNDEWFPKLREIDCLMYRPTA